MGQACSADCSKGNAADEFETAHALSYSYSHSSQQQETPVKNGHVHVAPSSSCCARQRLSSDDGLAPGDVPAGYAFDVHADAMPPAVAEIERVPAEGIAFEEIMSRLYIPDHDRAKAPVDTRKRFTAEKAVAYEAEDESIPDGEPQDDVEPEESRDDVLQGIFSGRPLYSVPSYLRDDKDIVLAAIRMEGAFCSDYIESQFLRSEDRDVVLALVRADGSLLETATEALRDDFEVVREAVRTNSGALRFASHRLQADRELKSLAAGQLKEEKRLTKLFADKCGSACAPPAACAPTRFWGR